MDIQAYLIDFRPLLGFMALPLIGRLSVVFSFHHMSVRIACGVWKLVRRQPSSANFCTWGVE